jgi:signal transduction histidine kinase
VGDVRVVIAYALLSLGAGAYAVSTLVRRPGTFVPLFDIEVSRTVEISASVLCLVGAARAKSGRASRWLIGLGMLLWSVGDQLFSQASPDGAPVPSTPDYFFLAFYPLAFAAVLLPLLRSGPRDKASITDGLMAALASATLVMALGADVTLLPIDGSWAAIVVTLAYPISDLALLSVVSAVLAVLPVAHMGRQLSWLAILVGVGLFAGCDTAYLAATADGTYRQGTLLDAGWMIALVVMSGVGWLPESPPDTSSDQARPGRLALPAMAGTIGLAILVTATQRSMPGISVVFATVTLVAAGARMLIAMRQVTSLEAERKLRVQAEEAKHRIAAREAENRALARRLSRLLDVAPVGIVEIDAAGRVQRWNRAAERILGWSRADVLGHPDPNPMLPSRQGETLTYLRKDGKSIEVEVAVSELTGPEHPNSKLKVVSDVTERNWLEVQLRHAQRLETVGRLAEGMAHELNSPLQFVTDSVQFLSEAVAVLQRVKAIITELSTDDGSPGVGPATAHRLRVLAAELDLDFLAEEAPQAATSALTGLERITTVVRAMRAFGGPSAESLQMMDVNESVKAVLVVTGPRIETVADVVTHLGTVPPIEVRTGDVHQVILDLIANALEAMEPTVAQQGRGQLKITTRVDAGDVVIEVSDTGCGIPESIAGQVFDPFFTTKPVGSGLGQGLSVARAVIVNGHGGSITFATEPGHGTTFSIRLPAMRPAIDAAEGAGAEPPLPRQRGDEKARG